MSFSTETKENPGTDAKFRRTDTYIYKQIKTFSSFSDGLGLKLWMV